LDASEFAPWLSAERLGERERDEESGKDGIVEDTVGNGDERDGVVIVGLWRWFLGWRRAERERERKRNGSGLGEVKRKRGVERFEVVGKYTWCSSIDWWFNP
jgi:hypothetical protein